MKIHFEDRGQDFLTWEIDDHGLVTDCSPCQRSIWKRCLVPNAEQVQSGQRIIFLDRQKVSRKMMIPVASVEK